MRSTVFIVTMPKMAVKINETRNKSVKNVIRKMVKRESRANQPKRKGTTCFQSFSATSFNELCDCGRQIVAKSLEGCDAARGPRVCDDS